MVFMLMHAHQRSQSSFTSTLVQPFSEKTVCAFNDELTVINCVCVYVVWIKELVSISECIYTCVKYLYVHWLTDCWETWPSALCQKEMLALLPTCDGPNDPEKERASGLGLWRVALSYTAMEERNRIDDLFERWEWAINIYTRRNEKEDVEGC